MLLGLGLGRFGGLTSKCLGRVRGKRPSSRSCMALLRTADRRRCNRFPISDAEHVGHKLTSSRSSSYVQRDIAGLGHGWPPAPGCHELPIRVAPFWQLHTRRVCNPGSWSELAFRASARSRRIALARTARSLLMCARRDLPMHLGLRERAVTLWPQGPVRQASRRPS